MKKVSHKTISRALLYIRTLENLIKEKKLMVSSKELAEITALSDVQIRKDISAFGRVGTPRVGYRAEDLKKTLEEFVLQQDVVHLALFGVGNLGKAILRYPGFHKDRIKLVAAFDKCGAKVDKEINGVRVYHIDQAPKAIQKHHADIGILAVPKENSQNVADVMVSSGLRAIVNFSPVSISVPKEVTVRDIDLSIEFLSLFCDSRL